MSVPTPSSMPGVRPQPVPHDPRADIPDAEEIQRQFDDVLNQVPADLEEEAAILSAAHEVLHNGLK